MGTPTGTACTEGLSLLIEKEVIKLLNGDHSIKNKVNLFKTYMEAYKRKEITYGKLIEIMEGLLMTETK